MGVRRRPLGTKVLLHLALVPFLVFALFPFYHMALTSLKHDRELYDRDAVPLLIRQGVTLGHYRTLLGETEFLTWTKNSLLVTALASFAAVSRTVPEPGCSSRRILPLSESRVIFKSCNRAMTLREALLPGDSAPTLSHIPHASAAKINWHQTTVRI